MRKVVAVVFSLAVGRMAMAETVNFDADALGAPPRGWTITMTGRGDPKWTVEKDDTAPSKSNVLKQSGKATYPLALKDGTSIKDGFVEVKFKALAGSEDRAAGLVWRAKDANNYYVVRANALEDNVVLYKTVNGVRNSLDIVGRKGGYGVKVPVPANQWHTLRVDFVEHASRSPSTAKPCSRWRTRHSVTREWWGCGRRPTALPRSMSLLTMTRGRPQRRPFSGPHAWSHQTGRWLAYAMMLLPINDRCDCASWSARGHEHACRRARWDGASASIT